MSLRKAATCPQSKITAAFNSADVRILVHRCTDECHCASFETLLFSIEIMLATSKGRTAGVCSHKERTLAFSQVWAPSSDKRQRWLHRRPYPERCPTATSLWALRCERSRLFLPLPCEKVRKEPISYLVNSKRKESVRGWCPFNCSIMWIKLTPFVFGTVCFQRSSIFQKRKKQ